jgi:hypothetical protein
VKRPSPADPVRFAEFAGYLSFAAVSGQPGILAGTYPDRLVADAAPGRGQVLNRGDRPPERAPGLDGSELVVTVIGLQVLGPDGVACAGTTAGSLPGQGRPGRRVQDGSMP